MTERQRGGKEHIQFLHGHAKKPGKTAGLGGLSPQEVRFEEPKSQLTKHLMDSAVLVVSHKDARNSGAYAAVILESLAGKTAGNITLELPSAADISTLAQNIDIVIIMFHNYFEARVEGLVKELTKANSGLYIVIVSALDTRVKQRLADLILDKLKVFGSKGDEVLEQELKNMLANPPLGENRNVGFEYMGKKLKDLSPAAQAAVTEGKVKQGYYNNRNQLGYFHSNSDGKPGGFVELTANVDPTATISENAVVLDNATVEPGAKVLEYSRITGDRVVRSSETVREWR